VINIHSHILPSLDDGAHDLSESISLLKLAIKDGITHIVATPHIHFGRYNNSIDSISQKFKLLQREAALLKLDIHLAMAAEVRLDIGLMALIKNNYVPFLGELKGSNCILIEFPHSHMPVGYEKFVSWLSEHNIITIVAHPERNRDIQKS
jgi:protein-tyrosine phosphatase